MSNNGLKLIKLSETDVKKLQQKIEEREPKLVADLFKAMGNENRLKILLSLLDKELCVYDLSGVVGLSISAVSHQLSHLKNQDLVRDKRDGKEIYYSIADQHVFDIINEAQAHVCEENCD
jgi:ArsR family transcriptional regulator